jgi:hypothetical protein
MEFVINLLTHGSEILLRTDQSLRWSRSVSSSSVGTERFITVFIRTFYILRTKNCTKKACFNVEFCYEMCSEDYKKSHLWVQEPADVSCKLTARTTKTVLQIELQIFCTSMQMSTLNYEQFTGCRPIILTIRDHFMLSKSGFGQLSHYFTPLMSCISSHWPLIPHYHY